MRSVSGSIPVSFVHIDVVCLVHTSAGFEKLNDSVARFSVGNSVDAELEEPCVVGSVLCASRHLLATIDIL